MPIKEWSEDLLRRYDFYAFMRWCRDGLVFMSAALLLFVIGFVLFSMWTTNKIRQRLSKRKNKSFK